MRRTYYPGQDWIFLKIYMGPETTESWLTGSLTPMLKDLREKQLVKKFFFMRFTDPDFHIRLRLELKEVVFFGEVVKLFNYYSGFLMETSQIWKTEIDTYDRELERYGNDWIENAEESFFFDTVFWLGLLHKFSAIPDGENKRWQAGLLSAHFLMNDFLMSMDSRIEMLGKMVKTLEAEFGGRKKIKLQINSKYRDYRELLENYLIQPEGLLGPVFKAMIKERSENIGAIEDFKIKTASWNEELLHRRVSDIIHLSLNRGLRSKHRMQEFVIYSFLLQLYISYRARGLAN